MQSPPPISGTEVRLFMTLRHIRRRLRSNVDHGRRNRADRAGDHTAWDEAKRGEVSLISEPDRGLSAVPPACFIWRK